MILPPAVPPYWFRFRLSRARGEEVAGVQHRQFRRYSNRSPWNAFDAGLGDHVDGGAGMDAETRRHGAGLDAELLERVGERKGKIDVRHGVGVVAAVQKVRGAVALAAGHGNPGGTVEGLAAGVAGVAVGRRAQAHDQLRGLPAVQRQFVDALLSR